MSNDPELRDEFQRLHRRLDRVERRIDRTHSFLWALLLVSLCTLALSVPLAVWFVGGAIALLVVIRIVLLYIESPGKAADRDRDADES